MLARLRLPLALLLSLPLGACGGEPPAAELVDLDDDDRLAEPEPEVRREAVEQVRARTPRTPAPAPQGGGEVPETPDDVSAPPAEAERTASGLASMVLQPGTGTEHPTADSRVQVHYTGWRSENGERFDSSVVRGQPIAFSLRQVIAGWTEGVQLMVEGEKRRFWIPANLAYGDGGGGRPGGMLVFDVELLDIL